MLTMQFGIETLFDRNGFKIFFPELLKYFFVFSEQFFVEFTGRGGGWFIFKMYFRYRRKVVKITIVPFHIVDDPFLAGEAVLKVSGDQR